MIVDFSTFSDLDITNSIEGVASDIAVIKRQINEAKSKAASTGDYSDTDWFHRANAALRYKGVEHQSLLQEKGKRSRAKKEAHTNTFERAFLQAARQILDADTFRVIMDAASIDSKKGVSQ